MVNFPQFKTLDLPGVVGSAEQIKGMRNRNALAQHQVDEVKKIAKAEAEYEDYKKRFDNMPEAIAQARAAGDHRVAGMLQQNYVSALTGTRDILDSVKGVVTDQESYDEFREAMIQSGAVPASALPAEYSGSFFDQHQKEVNAKLAKLKADTRKADAQAAKARRGDDPKGLRRVKASDSNTMARQVASMFGGSYDPVTHEFSFSNKAIAAEAQSMMADAEKLWETEGLSHAQAVKRAADLAKVKGIRPSYIPEEDPENPFNLKPPASETNPFMRRHRGVDGQ